MEKLTTINQRTYGRYFGICTSFHHSKGCLCPKCPSYDKNSNKLMFCSRKSYDNHALMKSCLCEECYNYNQFKMVGNYFCQPDKMS